MVLWKMLVNEVENFLSNIVADSGYEALNHVIFHFRLDLFAVVIFGALMLWMSFVYPLSWSASA